MSMEVGRYVKLAETNPISYKKWFVVLLFCIVTTSVGSLGTRLWAFPIRMTDTESRYVQTSS